MALECYYMRIVLFIIFFAYSTAYECKKQTFTSLKGAFTSPLFPAEYPNDASCEYVIKAKKGHYVEITFSKFELEFPYKYIKTDYLQILDGKAHNRQQEIHLDGRRITPFKFISRTSRIFMKFHSDSVSPEKGFSATYKMLPQHRCDVSLKIKHGKVLCNRDKIGSATYCQVKCDETYKLDGPSKTFCQNDSFINTPSCFPDPAYHCNMHDTMYLNMTCRKNDGESFISECDVTCEYPYLLYGNETLKCTKGDWGHIPSCNLDPDVVGNCTSDPQYACPFSAEEIEDFQLVFFDDFGSVRELIFARGKGRYLQCHHKLCWIRRSTKKHVYQCEKLSYSMQKRNKFSEKRRQFVMEHCFRCQVSGCTPINYFS